MIRIFCASVNFSFAITFVSEPRDMSSVMRITCSPVSVIETPYHMRKGMKNNLLASHSGPHDQTQSKAYREREEVRVCDGGHDSDLIHERVQVVLRVLIDRDLLQRNLMTLHVSKNE